MDTREDPLDGDQPIAPQHPRRSKATRKLFLLRKTETGSGAHPASYSKDTGAFFLEVNRPERQTGRSSPSSAEVKNKRSDTSTPQYPYDVHKLKHCARSSLFPHLKRLYSYSSHSVTSPMYPYCQITCRISIIRFRNTACKISVGNENAFQYCLFYINCMRAGVEYFIPERHSPQENITRVQRDDKGSISTNSL
jgi:hypothetical protein